MLNLENYKNDRKCLDAWIAHIFETKISTEDIKMVSSVNELRQVYFHFCFILHDSYLIRVQVISNNV